MVGGLSILISIAVMVLSALSLYFSIKYIGGQPGTMRVVFLGLIISFAVLCAVMFIGIGAGIFIGIAALFIYKVAFKLSMPKAFAAWLLHYTLVFLAILAWAFA